MGQLLLFIVVALVVAAIVFGVTVMMGGGDSGLTPVEPDGRAAPLPTDRPLGEDDIARARFDTAWRGYRMAQVDEALQRAAYDIGYKSELIGVLEAEVNALREGRASDADALRRAREAAVAPAAGIPAAGLTAAGFPATGLTAAGFPAVSAAAQAEPPPVPFALEASEPVASGPVSGESGAAESVASKGESVASEPEGEAVESAPVEPR